VARGRSGCNDWFGRDRVPVVNSGALMAARGDATTAEGLVWQRDTRLRLWGGVWVAG
jgi:hypothetical protein